MANKTGIEWTDATWNPITGCSVYSLGCKHCYAMKLAGTRLQHHPSRAGLTVDTKNGPIWTGEVRLNEDWLTQPMSWKKPRMIFVCAHADLFHEAVPDDWIDLVFSAMELSPQHTFQVLTKRASRMRDYINSRAFKYYPLPNVWLGVSIEDQAAANERIPLLLDTPAAVRWISAEPLLGPVRLTGLFGLITDDEDVRIDALEGTFVTSRYQEEGTPLGAKLDWVVVGGESGPKARPMHPQWARDLRDQCAEAGVPFLFKQWGEWLPDNQNSNIPNAHEDGVCLVGKKSAGRLLDGVQHDGYPPY